MMDIYTDGACSRNGYPDAQAGYGVYFENKSWDISARLKGKQTNNCAEMYAVYAAIKRLYWKNYKGIATIITDSKIVYDGLLKRKNSTAANYDLWLKIYRALDCVECKILFKKCKGHSGLEGNEIADKLAVKGRKKPKRK